MTNSKKLRFIFASELPEVVLTNTVYFLNNNLNKSIVVIGDVATNKITFNSVEVIEKYLTNGFIAVGDTAKEARDAIQAAAKDHGHSLATQTESGFMSDLDKIKLDSIVELSEEQATDPESVTYGLVSGFRLKQVFTEFLKRSSVETPEGIFTGVEFEIGFIYTGLTKPSQGVWVETDQIYLKDSFPDLYSAVGLKPLGPPSYVDGNVSATTVPNNKSAIYAFEKWWMSSGGDIYSSTNGIDFNLVSEVTGGDFRDLFLFKGKLFLPSTNSNLYFVSSDGITWSSSNFNPYVSAFNPKTQIVDDILVVTNATNNFIFTEDLVTWTVTTAPIQLTDNATIVQKVNGVYFIFQSTVEGGGACYSTDLTNWTTINFSVKVENSPIYFNGYYFVLLAASNAYLRSSDLVNWYQFSAPTNVTSATNVKLYKYKEHLLWLQNNTFIVGTTDGETWTDRAGSTDTVNLSSLEDYAQAVTEDENYFYVLTTSGFTRSSDGLNWKSQVNTFFTSSAPTFIKYQGNFLFMRINNRLVVTSDLTNWYDILNSGTNGYPVAFNGKDYLVVPQSATTKKLAITSYDTNTQFYIPPLKYPEAGIYKQWIKAL